MKVSVIVTVYNVEKYLNKCLDSLINQSLDNFEIIVVNDGSPDNSQKIIDEYVSKYPKIVKSYIKENGGLSDARNYGIKKAQGDFIALVDSDDYVSPCFLEKLYDKAICDDLELVVCDTIEVYENKEVYIKSDLNYSTDNVLNYLISPPMSCIRLFKKNIFAKNEFKKGILYEDLELTPGLVNYTKKVGFVNDGLYYYVQRSGSIMKQTQFNEKLLDIFDVLNSNKLKLYDEFSLEVEYMYITHLLRTATLRFLGYDNTRQYLNKIVQIMKNEFPNWRNNIYFKKSSLKLKIICFCAYHRFYMILKLMKKITGK